MRTDLMSSPEATTSPRRRQFCALGLAGAVAVGPLMLAGCATPAGNAVTEAAARAELGRSGRLRAAINLGNPILARQGARPGAPEGVSVDLAREVARRLNLELELVEFQAAGKVVEAATAAQVDLAFVAIDPVRGAGLDYTAPYVVIEGAYMVTDTSPLKRNEDVDRVGVRVAVGRGSAYDLFLTRELKFALLERAPTSQQVTDLFLSGGLEVAAGVRQQLEADMRRLAGTATPPLRLLPGRFMAIEQAVAVPKGRAAAQAWLTDFLEEMNASGFVAESLKRHGIDGAAVAPARRR
ncbi:polar amino acid transport system substrate-binding protein [Roseateles sp. YR242]|uniref:transporter substrate-binding domain-containing protein n=1 Tax=Roseateles sp. YR242 TaxID=1855305 RepID=UPI0008B30BD7|nr:transporter substrate-binding domain-containing protein [Roseateles sp. YR242]SEL74235.1 polar amino acid transport system substrate-binding protein [Roseateles sp. YR242]